MKRQLRNKKSLIAQLFVSVLLSGCIVQLLAASESKPVKGIRKKYVITNPTSLSFEHEPVSIPITELSQSGPLAGLIAQNNEKLLAAQTDDSNFDGTVDSFVFLLDMEPQSNTIVIIESVDKMPVINRRAHAEISLKSGLPEVVKEGKRIDNGMFITQKHAVRHPKHIVNDGMYRFAGPLIESDKIGYRLYWAKHAAIDVYGKTSSIFVGAGHNCKTNHHTMQPWGRDLLHNGKALGIGGLGVGCNVQRFSVGRAPHSEIIIGSDGPIKASYRLKIKDLEYQGKTYDINWDISMCAGKHYLKHDISVTKGGRLDLLAAMTNHTEDHKVVQSQSIDCSGQLDWVATYGDQCYPDTNKILAKESNEQMGLALLWPHDLLREYIIDDLEFEAAFKPARKIEYYSLAVYNLEPGTDILNNLDFINYVNTLSKRLSNSLIVEQEK